MSNADSAAITVTVTQTPISWRRLGSVIEKNSRIAPAPSICAASYSAGSILLMPVSKQHGAEAEQHPGADDADRR